MYGRVKIVPICAGGEIPDEDILADVLAACSADRRAAAHGSGAGRGSDNIQV